MKPRIGILFAVILWCVLLAFPCSAYFIDRNDSGELLHFYVSPGSVTPTIDGVISDDEYMPFPIDYNNDISIAVPDEAMLDAIDFEANTLRLSYDAEYVYIAATTSAADFHNGCDNYPGNMWGQHCLQVSLADVHDDDASMRLEAGYGLSSDTGAMLFVNWADGQGIGYEAEPGRDFVVVKNGDRLIYELRIPYGAFQMKKARAGDAIRLCVVWATGTSEDDLTDEYRHVQLAYGCTGDPGKDVTGHAVIHLTGGQEQPELPDKDDDNRSAGLGKSYTAPYFTPVIDGYADSIWDSALWTDIDVGYNDGVRSGCSARAKIAHNDKLIYVLAEVKDDTIAQNPSENPDQDLLEFYIDEDYCLEPGVCDTFSHLRLGLDGHTMKAGSNSVGLVEDMVKEFKVSTSANGYVMEFSIAPMNGMPADENTPFGLEFMYNDCDEDGTFLDALRWNVDTANGDAGPYANVDNFGKLTFAPAPELPAVLVGDLNADGTVDIHDASLLLQHSIFPKLYPVSYSKSLDFDRDGSIDIRDAVRLIQYSMYPEDYPIEEPETPEEPDGLAFTSNGDGTCYVSGIGTCTDEELVIPSLSPAGETVTGIGESAFEGCSALSAVSMPDTITKIGDWAFSGCEGLTEVLLPNQLTVLGSGVFNECIALTDITLPDTLNFIGNIAFNWCTGLKSIVIPDGVTAIDDWTFSCCFELSEVTLPDSIASIGENAFQACLILDNIRYGGTKAQWNAVKKADNWDDAMPIYKVICTDGDIRVSGSLYYVSKGDGTCYVGSLGTYKDTTLCIPEISPSGDRVTGIGYEAFRNCTALTSVTIPDSVTSISSLAFEACTSLNSVFIPDSIVSIGNNVFCGCDNLCEIHFPGTYAQWNAIGNSAHWNDGLDDFVTFHFTDGYYVGTLGFVPNRMELSYVSNGDGTCYVSGIGTCTNTDIVIPETSPTGDRVTGIGEYAFQNCSSLTSVSIPESVTDIGTGAFLYCSALTSVDLPSGITTIAPGTFFWCTSLQSVAIPEKVTAINNNAFTYCLSLTSVTIPESVTFIDFGVFEDCSSLENIYYSGTQAQWDVISKGDGWDTFTGSYAVHCAEDTADDTVLDTFENGAQLVQVISGVIDVAYDYSTYSAIDLVSGKKVTVKGNGLVENSFYVVKDGTAAFKADENTAANQKWVAANTVKVVFNGGTVGEIKAQPTSLSKAAADGASWTTNLGAEKTYGIDKIVIYEVSGNRIALNDAQTAAKTIAIKDSNLKTSHLDGETGDRTLTNVLSYIVDGTMIVIGNPKTDHCAEDAEYSVGLSYTSNGDGTCYVSGIGTCTDTDIVIPETSPDGDRVTGIGESAFKYRFSLASVTIPDSVTSIGDSAFFDCKSLTSVTIPNGVTSIGNNAFSGCAFLTSVTIPDSVTSIGKRAFYDCTSLTSVIIPDSVTSIGESAFAYCSDLTSVNIQGSITSIGGWTFEYCYCLTSINIPDSVTSIGKCAFENCSALTSITIPDSVTSIGDDAFFFCRFLKDIYYSGTQAQWDAISKGKYWDTDIGIYFIHCTDITLAQ